MVDQAMDNIKSDVRSALKWLSGVSLVRVSQAQPRKHIKKQSTSWQKQARLNDIQADQVYLNSFGSINLP
ncbi:unnamed protein product [Bursaphelenchus okinawaensis]|uniref:Uncharacterized protein n=1 Tax=Bursaphelenchus okinawaensis TaxID=465554 RepID=A0A811KL94_9BILA|nr:unnamed protein product [Bursaphelenchus okinawaensis]CAG9106932.1 unnamed protein product [Bursaphelenchus okinawaensis]